MSKGESYSGLVIGGPWAGLTYTGERARVQTMHAPLERVGTLPEGTPRYASSFPREDVTYAWTEMFGVPIWVPADWSRDEVVTELFKSYRPHVGLRSV